jgi:hypothetical protein
MPKTRRRNPNIKGGVGREERDSQHFNDKSLDKSGKGKEDISGSVGTLRIIVDGEYPYLEIKSKEGWVRSDSSSASGFSFKK